MQKLFDIPLPFRLYGIIITSLRAVLLFIGQRSPLAKDFEWL